MLAPWSTLSYVVGLQCMVSGSDGHPCTLIFCPLRGIVPGGFELAPLAFVLFAQLVLIFPTYSGPLVASRGGLRPSHVGIVVRSRSLVA